MGLLVDQVDLLRAETAALLAADVTSVAAFAAGIDRGQVVVREAVCAQQGALFFGELL